MSSIRTRDRLAALGLVLAVIGVDRLSKAAVLVNERLMSGAALKCIPGIVSFCFTWNKGAAFSALSSAPGAVIALMILFLLVVGAVLFYPKHQALSSRLFIALVFAGGVSNFIDRLLYGAVVDFIRLDFVNFAIFNAADVAVTLGAALYAASAFWPRGRGGKKH